MILIHQESYLIQNQGRTSAALTNEIMTSSKEIHRDMGQVIFGLDFGDLRNFQSTVFGSWFDINKIMCVELLVKL